jgi:hypothetical protein
LLKRVFALAIVAAVLPAQGVGALAAQELGASSAWVPLQKVAGDVHGTARETWSFSEDAFIYPPRRS